MISFFFFFNDTATTEIYTLSLHDALPICRGQYVAAAGRPVGRRTRGGRWLPAHQARRQGARRGGGPARQGPGPQGQAGRRAGSTWRGGQGRSEERRVGKEWRSRWAPYH